jgi:hypothetical protein
MTIQGHQFTTNTPFFGKHTCGYCDKVISPHYQIYYAAYWWFRLNRWYRQHYICDTCYSDISLKDNSFYSEPYDEFRISEKFYYGNIVPKLRDEVLYEFQLQDMLISAHRLVTGMKNNEGPAKWAVVQFHKLEEEFRLNDKDAIY